MAGRAAKPAKWFSVLSTSKPGRCDNTAQVHAEGIAIREGAARVRGQYQGKLEHGVMFMGRTRDDVLQKAFRANEEYHLEQASVFAGPARILRIRDSGTIGRLTPLPIQTQIVPVATPNKPLRMGSVVVGHDKALLHRGDDFTEIPGTHRGFSARKV